MSSKSVYRHSAFLIGLVGVSKYLFYICAFNVLQSVGKDILIAGCQARSTHYQGEEGEDFIEGKKVEQMNRTSTSKQCS